MRKLRPNGAGWATACSTVDGSTFTMPDTPENQASIRNWPANGGGLRLPDRADRGRVSLAVGRYSARRWASTGKADR